MTLLRSQLAPPELEAEFREDGLAQDRRVTAGLILVTATFLLLTIPGTIPLEAERENIRLVWTIRAVDLAVALAALFAIRRVSSPRAYDSIITWWVGIWFVGIIGEDALLPATSTQFIWWDVFLTVTLYAAVPLPLVRQAALAAIISLGDLFVLWKFKSPGPWFSMLDVTLAYACANIAGIFVSRERHRWRRRAFLAFRKEVVARTELQLALHEVKTLQGIIPICSHCKNVRTERGDWQQIEAYVHVHSEAEFSHGICPNCMRLLYPDFADG